MDAHFVHPSVLDFPKELCPLGKIDFAPLHASASFAGLRHYAARKVFFAAYMPPQKTDWIFFAPLRRRELCETFLYFFRQAQIVAVDPVLYADDLELLRRLADDDALEPGVDDVAAAHGTGGRI